MNLFSYNAFLLGAIVFLVISLSNIIYVWLCKIWKVKIVEFSIFLNPWFTLFKKEMNGTTYKLGWLPLGAYIKPFGMSKEDSESIATEELPYSFSGKSKTKQALFTLTPFLVCLLVLLLSLVALKGAGNMLMATEEMFTYMSFAIKTMFGYGSHDELVKMTSNMLIDKNIIAFAATILISVFLVLTLLSKAMSFFPEGEKANGLVKLIGFIVVIGVVYLICWKIPKFVFSFFSFGQSISYIVSSLVGLYVVGILIFILAMIVAKFRLTTQK